jgi:hypothetical protein
MKIQQLYKNPKKWIKNEYNNGRGGYCLSGALWRCYKKEDERDVAAKKLRVAIKQYLERKTLPGIISFNDSKKTTFKDIIEVVKLANV